MAGHSLLNILLSIVGTAAGLVQRYSSALGCIPLAGPHVGEQPAPGSAAALAIIVSHMAGYQYYSSLSKGWTVPPHSAAEPTSTLARFRSTRCDLLLLLPRPGPRLQLAPDSETHLPSCAQQLSKPSPHCPLLTFSALT